MQKLITIHPDLCNGKPTIRGLRITVRSILEHLAAGDSAADILTAYPFLNEEDIYACLAFAAQAVDREAIVYKLAG
ncbi:MAG: DUF433 domain-containing protein [Bacteroidia bacterium]